MNHLHETLAAIPVVSTAHELDELELQSIDVLHDDDSLGKELLALVAKCRGLLPAKAVVPAAAAEPVVPQAARAEGETSAEQEAPGAAPAAAGATATPASTCTVNSAATKSATRSLKMSDFPHVKTKTDKDGTVSVAGLLCTIENLAHMLRGYCVELRYNEMTRLREISMRNANFSGDNADERAMDCIENLAVINGMNFGAQRLSGAVSTIAEQDCYHPVRQWIDSKPWDKKSRLAELYATLSVKRGAMEKHRDRLMRRWLISGAAALYSKSYQHRFELVLTLQGLQGKGKSYWFMSLVPSEFRAVKDNLELDPRNKDNVFTLAGHFITELGELDSTFSKSDLGRIKGFLSNTADKLRRPYARSDSDMKRQTLIGATVNKPDFLIDDTGNRRFLTLPITGVNFQHQVDMQQLWAELKSYFEAGEQWWLTDDERSDLDRVNENFEVTSPIAELLTDAFEFLEVGTEDKRHRANITATQVACLFDLPRDRKTVGEASSALRKLTGQDWVKSNGQKVWRVVPNQSSRYYTKVKYSLNLRE